MTYISDWHFRFNLNGISKDEAERFRDILEALAECLHPGALVGGYEEQSKKVLPLLCLEHGYDPKGWNR